MKTPQDKAKELVEKFSEFTAWSYPAKECAKIAVNEILEALDEFWASRCDDHNMNELKAHWHSVLECLENNATMKTKESKYKKGNVFHIKGNSTIRVLDVIEGYVVFRYKGAAPGLLAESEFEERLKREYINNPR